MGEPLSPDRVFNFPEDELEPHPAYDFFVPGPLLGYAGNPNNNNRWLEADDYLLEELEAMANEPMVGLMVNDVAEPVAEAEEEHVVAPIVDMAEEQMAAPVMDIEEDLAVLFGEDDDFEDDDFTVQPPSVYEVGGPSTAAAEGPSFPHSAPRLPIPPLVSDAEVVASVLIGEISPRVLAMEGHMQVMASQIVHAADRWEQVGAGLAGSATAERHANPAAADYSFRDGQSGEHADVVYFGIG
nr:hypothetical protein [Tanacetum cinerariifolium]